MTRNFLMNGLDQANKVLGSCVFRKEEWTCTGCYDTIDHFWRRYYAARKDLVFDLAESTIKIGRGERVLANRSAKWRQCEVEKVSSAAGYWVAKTWRDDDSTYGNMPPLMYFNWQADQSLL